MDNLKSIFDSFYSNFILRDFMAKIIPGSSIVAVLIYPYAGKILKHSDFFSSGWLWFFVLGFSWILGLSMQSIGEATCCIRYYPKIIDNKSYEEIIDEIKSLKLEEIDLDYEGCKKLPKPDPDKTWYKFINEYNKSSNDKDSKNFERFVVIKEASGNLAAAMVVCSVKLFFDFLITNYKCYNIYYSCLDEECIRIKNNLCNSNYFIESLPAIVMIFVIIYFLKRMHRVHVKRQFIHMAIAIKEKDSCPQPEY